jgi:hypothetical protein
MSMYKLIHGAIALIHTYIYMNYTYLPILFKSLFNPIFNCVKWVRELTSLPDFVNLSYTFRALAGGFAKYC